MPKIIVISPPPMAWAGDTPTTSRKKGTKNSAPLMPVDMASAAMQRAAG